MGHEGICGAHQLTYKMKWVIHKSGYFWPTILEDYFEYYKGCQECQCFGNIQKSPASAMNPIIKPWPFWGWGIDLIGQIFPPSSKGHKFILVATDYFTKWVEAIPLKMITSKNMVDFIKELLCIILEFLKPSLPIKGPCSHQRNSEILLPVWGSSC